MAPVSTKWLVPPNLANQARSQHNATIARKPSGGQRSSLRLLPRREDQQYKCLDPPLVDDPRNPFNPENLLDPHDSFDTCTKNNREARVSVGIICVVTILCFFSLIFIAFYRKSTMFQKLGGRFRQRLVDASLTVVQTLEIRNAWKKRSPASEQPTDVPAIRGSFRKLVTTEKGQADSKETANSHDQKGHLSQAIRSIAHPDTHNPHFFSTSEKYWTSKHSSPGIGNGEDSSGQH
ncbi:hypothetical protein DL770_009534 [Monosporascus sp. CRB-9-2]|nr:hypothetical protein DL770_009534 [Monosporascus sp. CRB-9-2]